MIRIFSTTDKIFTSNGDKVLIPLKAKVTKVDNGDYYLYIEAGLEYTDYLIENNILVANTPQGDQAFRIGNVTKTRKKITFKAWHVFYDSENLLIADSYVVDKNCKQALQHLNNATDTLSPFEVDSDITSIDSYRCVRTSLYGAVQTVIERWGGHLVRDNFTIAVMQDIGQDSGVTIRYRKNLKEISCAENWDNVVTKLLPVGKDGILLNALDASADIYLYSSLSYDLPYTKTVSFDQDINPDDYPSETAYKQELIADLEAQGEAYIDKNQIPEVNYTIKANISQITDIGDAVEVIDERLGIDLLAKVISYEYDCISERYTQIEFGNYQKTLSNLMSSIQTTAEYQSTVVAENVGQAIINDVNTTLTGSYIIFNSDNILVVDRLPKESAVNVIKIDKNGISVSGTGVSGTYHVVWGIDRGLNFNEMTVSNLSASGIQKGTLKLNSTVTASIYSGTTKIGSIDNHGLVINGTNDTVKIDTDGISVFDANNTKIFYIASDSFQITKANIGELSINGSKVIDFELSRVSESGWNVIGLKSGNYECRGVKTVTPTYSSLTSGLYKGTASLTLPVSMPNAIITATIKSCSGVAWVAMCNQTSNTAFDITLVSTTNSGDVTINISVTQ